MQQSEWYIVYTTPNGERLAQGDLEKLGFRVFLPVAKVWHRPARHRRQQGKKLIERPLFPRYLFVALSPLWRDFVGVRRSKRVVEILCDGHREPVVVPEAVVTGMMGDIESGRHDAAVARAEKLAALLGRTVELTDGPFKGFLGTITRASKTKARLELRGFHGAAFSLELALGDLEANGVFQVQDDQHKQSARSGVG